MPFTQRFRSVQARPSPPSTDQLRPRPGPGEVGSAIARLPRRSTLPAHSLNDSFHASLAKALPRVALIDALRDPRRGMRAAAQPKILNRVLAAHCPRVHMVEL